MEVRAPSFSWQGLSFSPGLGERQLVISTFKIHAFTQTWSKSSMEGRRGKRRGPPSAFLKLATSVEHFVGFWYTGSPPNLGPCIFKFIIVLCYLGKIEYILKLRLKAIHMSEQDNGVLF
jgi:hypothetical protein